MKHPSILKRIENFKDEMEEMTLLQTIKIPKNLGYLTEKLPQANYEKFPNKRNLSFSNNNEKEKVKVKKNMKKLVKAKENENNDHKENNDDATNNSVKKYPDDEEDGNKRKKHGSADQSHISGNNAANIKVIKNTELNNSNVKDRAKSPYMEKEKRMKEINSSNVHLPNIKNQGSVDDIRGNNRNK
jgi:hypothetical protein